MTVKTIRWGIMGAGGIAHRFAKSVSVVDNTELVAVASKTPGKAEQFSSTWNLHLAFSDYETLLKRDDIDAIYIATTHNFHFECAELALQHGKAVLCEKPLTVNAKQTETLINLANEKNVFLMEAMWMRFLPAMAQAKSWIKEGKIGEFRHLKADFGIYVEKDPQGRMYNRDLAGGALLDLGVYPVAFAQMITEKEPEKIQCYGAIGDTQVDEQTAAIFDYADGTYAFASCSMCAHSGNTAEIVGTKGVIKIPALFFMTDELTLETPTEKIHASFPYEEEEGFKYEIEEVVACLQAGRTESSVHPLQNTLNTMKTMDLMREQMQLRYAEDE